MTMTNDDSTNQQVPTMSETSITELTAVEPVVEIQETPQATASLDQFTFSIRHRTSSPFAHGNFEGRLKLAAGEYIVSSTTLADVISAMTVKADSLIANGYKVQA
jgi:hypothetical protein